MIKVSAERRLAIVAVTSILALACTGAVCGVLADGGTTGREAIVMAVTGLVSVAVVASLALFRNER